MGSSEQKGEGEQREGDVVPGEECACQKEQSGRKPLVEVSRPQWLSLAGTGEIVGPVTHGS